MEVTDHEYIYDLIKMRHLVNESIFIPVAMCNNVVPLHDNSLNMHHIPP